MRCLRHHHGEVGTRPVDPVIELLIRGVNLNTCQRSGRTLVVHRLQRFTVSVENRVAISLVFAHDIDREAGFAMGFDLKWNHDSAIARFTGGRRAHHARGTPDLIEPLIGKSYR